MEKVKKFIDVTEEDRVFLMKVFKVSRVSLWRALNNESQSDMSRRIRKAAIERGGKLMKIVPEAADLMETFHDRDGVIRQQFPNGAVLELSKVDGTGDVIKDGKVHRHYERVMLTDIPSIQNYAIAL